MKLAMAKSIAESDGFYDNWLEPQRAVNRRYLDIACAALLVGLNAALDAGVAREIPDDQALIAYAVFDDKFPALIIRTGP